MDKSFIQEAFRQVYLTEDAEEFALNTSGPDDTESFLDIVNSDEFSDENISDVYDLEAEAKEDLKQSYIGKVIIDCNVCHSNVFVDKDEITENKDGVCCEELECPYCMSNEGYTIIGEVKPYQEADEDTDEIEDIEVNTSDDEPVEIEADEEPEEDEDLEEGLKADKVKALQRNDKLDGQKGLGRGKGLEASDDIRGPKYSELNESYWWEDSKNLPKERTDEISKWAKEYVYQICEDELEHYYIIGPKFEDSNEKFTVIINNKIFNFDWADVWVNKAFYDENEEENLPDDYTPIYDCIEDDPIGYRIINTIESSVDYSDGRLHEAWEFVDGRIGDKIEDAFDESVDKNLYSKVQKAMNEDIEDISVSTSNETTTISTKDDGGVVVETSPKEDEDSFEEYTGDEMIAPIEPETESDISDTLEADTEDTEEVSEDEMFDEIPEEETSEEAPEGEGEDEFEEFDEESFNDLGESYLKRCYENVTSFETSRVTLNENKDFVVEGNIGFDSGNKKATQFVFSQKSNNDGKLKLEGYNKQISRGKKTFKLNCSVNNKTLVCESLNYNYKGKNDLNESVRVYGTVKRK